MALVQGPGVIGLVWWARGLPEVLSGLWAHQDEEEPNSDLPDKEALCMARLWGEPISDHAALYGGAAVFAFSCSRGSGVGGFGGP